MSNNRTKKRGKRRRKANPGRLYLQHAPGARPGALGVPRGLRQRPVVHLGNGELGYGMARTDDCLLVALATAIQVPPEQIPDPRLDDRLKAGDDPQQISRDTWTRLAYWLRGRGLRLVLHETVPVDRERWIGVCPGGEGIPAGDRADRFIWESTPFRDHCLVMSYDRIHFDPGISIQIPRGMRLHSWTPSHVGYGLSIDTIDRKE